ncbi:MAG: RraA family protein [Chromatiaceae bacterium]|nr:MAG: RraA family protein [Chromatiaceae bacterium]
MTDFSTADLYDRFGDELAVCAPLFRDYGGHVRFCGAAVTVKCFEDNSRIKEALAEPGAGRVLVADAGGSVRCAMLGDLIAASAVTNGWAGVVLTAAVRDTAALAGMALGIKALAATPRKSVRRGEGQRDLPVDIGGEQVRPGDWVYADGDGILIARAPLPLAPEAATSALGATGA